MIRSDQIWLVWEPIDMRAGMDRLSAWLQDSLGRSPCDGSAFVFRNRRTTRLKLLLWDGNMSAERVIAMNNLHRPANWSGARLQVGKYAARMFAASHRPANWSGASNGVEPYAWLKDTLEKLPTWPNSRLDELLPLRPKTST